MRKRTKIVCTIGPACKDERVLRGMIENGMNVARLNFSHMEREEADRIIALLKNLRSKLHIPLAIMLDTKGPEVRLYGYREPVPLSQNDIITIKSYEKPDLHSKETGNKFHFYTNLPSAGSLCRIGSRVLLMDGFIEGEIIDKNETCVKVRIRNSGLLRTKAHFAIPGTEYPLPFLSEKDREDIIFAAEKGLEYIALSFVGSANNIFTVRNLIHDRFPGSAIQLIAKIENKAAIDHLDEIISHADGIMVARGDLGVELDMAEVPVMQKRIIEKSYLRGKPVITATQMLESMINNPIPTRAEASDVANACYDLTSAVMLSGETAVGSFPELVVKTMSRIIEKAEEGIDYNKIFRLRRESDFSEADLTSIVCRNAISITDECGAKVLVVITKTGYSARMVSRLRSKIPILAMTYQDTTYNQLELNWGVNPEMIEEESSIESIIQRIGEICLERGVAERGDRIVIIAGLPLGRHGTTNMVRVETVGKKPVRGIALNKKTVSGSVVYVKEDADINTKDLSGKIVFLSDFKKDYVPYLKLVAGIVMETYKYEHDLSLLGIAYNIPIFIDAKGVFEQIKEGSVVELRGDRNIISEL